MQECGIQIQTISQTLVNKIGIPIVKNLQRMTGKISRRLHHDIGTRGEVNYYVDLAIISMSLFCLESNVHLLIYEPLTQKKSYIVKISLKPPQLDLFALPWIHFYLF